MLSHDRNTLLIRVLPGVNVVSYQCSESSTSEGIEQVFDKAEAFRDEANDIISVVLLDEAGLAENSPNNPLKVLHSRLEPTDGSKPKVAVVGISNWALDTAKMNRAIHISRPDPTKSDLEETAFTILGTFAAHGARTLGRVKYHVPALAGAYHK